MAKIEIKNRYTDKVIFEYSKGGNTLEETVEIAVKSKVSLREADLRDADLKHADLKHADLREANLIEAILHGADLNRADLRGANLSRADLHGVDLRGADLSRANLRDANLHEADLRRAILHEAILSRANLHEAILDSCMGNQKEIITLQVDTYPISFTKQDLQIGCKNFTHDEWRNFTDKKIDMMDARALVWWKKWKDWLFLTIELRFGEEK